MTPSSCNLWAASGDTGLDTHGARHIRLLLTCSRWTRPVSLPLPFSDANDAQATGAEHLLWRIVGPRREWRAFTFRHPAVQLIPRRILYDQFESVRSDWHHRFEHGPVAMLSTLERGEREPPLRLQLDVLHHESWRMSQAASSRPTSRQACCHRRFCQRLSSSSKASESASWHFNTSSSSSVCWGSLITPIESSRSWEWFRSGTEWRMTAAGPPLVTDDGGEWRSSGPARGMP